MGEAICQQFENPIRPDPVLRALLFDLDEWVADHRDARSGAAGLLSCFGVASRASGCAVLG